MKHSSMLTIASLLSILFGTFHLADDIDRGMSPGGLPNLIAVVICVVWLYGTLVLAERRSGYIIILVASLLLMGVPVIHARLLLKSSANTPARMTRLFLVSERAEG